MQKLVTKVFSVFSLLSPLSRTHIKKYKHIRSSEMRFTLIFKFLEDRFKNALFHDHNLNVLFLYYSDCEKSSVAQLDLFEVFFMLPVLLVVLCHMPCSLKNYNCYIFVFLQSLSGFNCFLACLSRNLHWRTRCWYWQNEVS